MGPQYQRNNNSMGGVHDRKVLHLSGIKGHVSHGKPFEFTRLQQLQRKYFTSIPLQFAVLITTGSMEPPKALRSIRPTKNATY